MGRYLTRQRINSGGTSLISAVMALGIVGVATVALSTMTVNSKKAITHSELRGQLSIVASQLRDHIDCAATVATQTSSIVDGSGQFLLQPMIRNSDGTLLPFLGHRDETSNNQLRGTTTFGSWRLRLTLVANKGVQLDAARIDSTGKFNQDPLTNQDLTFSSKPNPLLSDNLGLCRAEASTTPAVCSANERAIKINGSMACMELATVCTMVGFGYDAASGKCVTKLNDAFGGLYQRGEKSYAGPNCESPNPETGSCSCPPGFSDFKVNKTCEESSTGYFDPLCGSWDEDHLCFRI